MGEILWFCHFFARFLVTLIKKALYTRKLKYDLFDWFDSWDFSFQDSRIGASTTLVLVLPEMINMDMLKILYSSTDFPVIVVKRIC